MESKLMMTNNNRHEARNIVHKARVSVPRNSCRPVNRAHDCNNVQFLIDNRSNFKRSGRPDRLMYYEDGSWLDFSHQVSDLLLPDFLNGKPMIEVEIGGSKCLFDFYRMILIDFDHGNQKSIAWIDVNGKCFFPKTFVSGARENVKLEIGNVTENLSSDVPKIEIEIRISDGSNSNKRKREGLESESEGSSSNDQRQELKKPQLLESDVESPRWQKAKLLKEGEKYKMVKRLGSVEPGGVMITAIHQFMRTGPLDRARSEVFQKQLENTKAARGGEANMTLAWHGTSGKGVESILTHGFGMPSKIPSSETHGIGIYLSPARSPHLSAMLSEVDDNGEKHAILCRVILGKCEKIEVGSQQSYPSSVNFDTGVDDVENPKWYVVWCANMNTHILPEFVVSYRSSNHMTGQLNGSSILKWMPNASNSLAAKLFSKLQSSLPSCKVRELQTLCGTYKDGKVAKDAFLKRLRVIVGNEMLLSAVREIRG